MMQGQYETYYAGMMGTTAEELWSRMREMTRRMKSQ